MAILGGSLGMGTEASIPSTHLKFPLALLPPIAISPPFPLGWGVKMLRNMYIAIYQTVYLLQDNT